MNDTGYTGKPFCPLEQNRYTRLTIQTYIRKCNINIPKISSKPKSKGIINNVILLDFPEM